MNVKKRNDFFQRVSNFLLTWDFLCCCVAAVVVVDAVVEQD
jgi:hypothetical protein